MGTNRGVFLVALGMATEGFRAVRFAEDELMSDPDLEVRVLRGP